MGLYDAVERNDAGGKKEKTLHKPLLIVLAIFVVVIGLVVWACRYQIQYRAYVSALADATADARSSGAFAVTVDGAAAAADADDLGQLLGLIRMAGPGRLGDAPDSAPIITIEYGDGTTMEIWEKTLDNPANDWTEGPFFRFTFANGRTYGYDTDQIPMYKLRQLFS